MYHDRDDLDNRSSDEEIFYPSNEAIREDTDQPRRSRDDSVDSELYRDHFASLPPRGQTPDHRDEYIRELHDALDRQGEEIKDLGTKLQDLRGEVREYFSSLEQKLSCFEEKVDLVINLVSSWAHHPSRDRRCRGFCSKHVRTDKCLCRGLKEPHRCCGRIGGICDC
ncbi:hypothetical protein OS493_037818 [Desmophyllum pertusum]|uniref:Uncharacterized protein n=1 Tax=Desmophyllum pertusum TaxID=174260 RepID=A0A9W9ZHS4_9CNID|nr:hypothetical protein OS493_037818 [Desmophyllum pertusum]